MSSFFLRCVCLLLLYFSEYLKIRRKHAPRRAEETPEAREEDGRTEETFREPREIERSGVSGRAGGGVP